MSLKMQGRCWVFGDNLGTHAEILPVPISVLLTRDSHDPKVLKDYLMTGVDPDFPRKVQKGDFIVAGKNFGHGNPHLWGYLTMKELGIGLIAESMARGGYRLAAVAGVSFLTPVAGITGKVKTGDRLEVDFETGEIKDLTSGQAFQAEPLPGHLLDIIRAGGQDGYLRRKLAPTLKHVTPVPLKD